MLRADVSRAAGQPGCASPSRRGDANRLVYYYIVCYEYNIVYYHVYNIL